MRRPLLIALVLAAITALVPTAALATPPVVDPIRLHVDCDAKSAGDGTRARPFNRLAQVNEMPLGPGARVKFRRGSICRGALAPRGSGTKARPIVIRSYGPTGERARIDGTGEDAVLLEDMSHVVLKGLEVTNRGDFSSKKRGVHVVAREATVRNVVLRGLYIHHVQGDLSKDSFGSGGIQVDNIGYGKVPPLRFVGLRIIDNRIREVSRSGIFITGTTDSSRPRATQPWPEASIGVIVRLNRIHGIGGDGIVPLGTDGAIVGRNVVSDGNRGGRSPADPRGLVCNAGIWTFHANNTVIQRNEVYDMKFNDCDGTAYDIDYDQDGTIVQYNLSHHNEGGFMLLCSDPEPRTAQVRFNLSVDDAYTFQRSPCIVPGGVSAGLDGIRVHNNTFVSHNHGVTTAFGGELPDIGNANSFEFRNNIVVDTDGDATPLPCGTNCSHNLFFGLPPSGTQFVIGDPAFADPTRRGHGRLQVGDGFRLTQPSPAAGAGVEVPGSGGLDYFGNPVGAPPDIGFHQPG